MSAAGPDFLGQFAHLLLPVLGLLAIVAGHVQHLAQERPVFLPPGAPLNLAQTRLQQVRVIDELAAGILPLFERKLLQDAPAKTVQREDPGLIEAIDGRAAAGPRCCSDDAASSFSRASRNRLLSSPVAFSV